MTELFHFLPNQNGVLVYGLEDVRNIAQAYPRRVYVVRSDERRREWRREGRVTYIGREPLNDMISKFSEKDLSTAFKDALVIIEDVHSYLKQENIFSRVTQCTTVKLVLMSPTALSGEPDDILVLLNMLRQNDKLPPVTMATILEAASYVHFYSKTYSAPYRVYPKLFDPFSGHIVVPNDGVKRTLENIDVYPVRCSAEQAIAYHNALHANENTQFKQAVLMSLTMSYPNGLYGKEGLNSVVDDKYQYLPGAAHVFSKLSTYSAKLNAVCAQAATATGVLLVFTKFVEGGAIPAALALEANGFRRYGGKSFLDGPTNGNYYVLLTGNQTLSPDNASEIEAATTGNAYGTRVKVIITTTNEVSFKNVRQVHVLEPWWHMERMEQLMGRCAGPASHSELPPTERNLQIFMYASILPNDEEGYDRHMYRYAETRSIQIGKITNLLKRTTKVVPGDLPVRQTLADGRRIDPPTYDLETWMGAS
jgi:hypothetical protein